MTTNSATKPVVSPKTQFKGVVGVTSGGCLIMRDHSDPAVQMDLRIGAQLEAARQGVVTPTNHVLVLSK